MITRPTRIFGLTFALLLTASSLSVRAVRANTLCVRQGGTGGCFSSIGAAISAATNGDTILIAGAASPYFERLTIEKSLNLIGDSAATTIIDAALAGQIIWITRTVAVTLTNLTIRNGQSSGDYHLAQAGGGIHSEGTS